MNFCFTKSVDHVIFFPWIRVHFKLELHSISPSSFGIHQWYLQMFGLVGNFIVHSGSLFQQFNCDVFLSELFSFSLDNLKDFSQSGQSTRAIPSIPLVISMPKTM